MKYFLHPIQNSFNQVDKMSEPYTHSVFNFRSDFFLHDWCRMIKDHWNHRSKVQRRTKKILGIATFLKCTFFKSQSLLFKVRPFSYFTIRMTLVLFWRSQEPNSFLPPYNLGYSIFKTISCWIPDNLSTNEYRAVTLSCHSSVKLLQIHIPK